MSITQCLLCERQISPVGLNVDRIYSYRCDVCGSVMITEHATGLLSREMKDKLHLLSGYTRKRTNSQLPPTILKTDNIEQIIDTECPKTVREKAIAVLKAFARMSDYPGSEVDINDLNYSLAYARNPDEFFLS